MKTISLSLIAIMLSVMAMGLILAEGDQTGVDDLTGEGNLIATQNSGDQTQLRIKVQDGTCLDGDGKQIQIRTEDGNRVHFMVGNFEANTDLPMTQEMIQNRTRLHVELSNGINSEVKVMPDAAFEKARERLGAKCEEDCTIELKQVGVGNQVKAAYEIKTQKQSKVLGLFKAQMQVQAQVDAETGEVIQAKKPWWAFLATE